MKLFAGSRKRLITLDTLHVDAPVPQSRGEVFEKPYDVSDDEIQQRTAEPMDIGHVLPQAIEEEIVEHAALSGRGRARCGLQCPC